MNSFLKRQYEIAQGTKETFIIKTIVCAFATVLMTLLVFLNLPVMVLAVSGMVLSGIVYLICLQEFNDALVSIFRLMPSNDSFNAVALVLVFIRSLSLLFINDVNTKFFCPVLFLSITISMVMKLLFAGEILANIETIHKKKTYLVSVTPVNLFQRMIKKVCMVRPNKEMPDIISTTYSDDPSEEKSRLFVLIMGGLIIIISLIVFILKGVNMFFTALSVLFVACATFTSEMTFVLPYLVSQVKLRKLGSILLGYHSITCLKDINTLLVTDSELFPQKLCTLETTRFIYKPYVAKAVEYTAALLNATRSPVRKSFMKTIDFPRDELPEIEDINIQKEYGVSSTIKGDKVLLGNRNLMLSHDIEPYHQEKEASLAAGSKMMYCAVNGELAAVFIFNYASDPEVRKTAEHIGGEFNILVDTDDCNVNEQMIKKQFDLQSTKIIVPNDAESDALYEMRHKVKERPDTPVMISTQKATGILASVKQAKNLSQILEYSILTKHISIVLGIVLTTAAIFLSPSSISSLWLLIYNLLWTVPVLILSFMKKD